MERPQAQCEVYRTTVIARCCCFVVFFSSIFFDVVAEYHTSFDFQDYSDNVSDLSCRSGLSARFYFPNNALDTCAWRGSCCYVTNTRPSLLSCAVIFHTTPSFRGCWGHFLSKYHDLSDGNEFSDDRMSILQIFRNGDIRPLSNKFKYTYFYKKLRSEAAKQFPRCLGLFDYQKFFLRIPYIFNDGNVQIFQFC